MESSQAEPLNKEGFAAFAERAGEDAPVVMLNLLAFKPDGGRKRYEEYGEAVAPSLAKVGGRIVFTGAPAPALLGEDSWDLVVLVEYPSAPGLSRHDRIRRVSGDRASAHGGAAQG